MVIRRDAIEIAVLAEETESKEGDSTNTRSVSAIS